MSNIAKVVKTADKAVEEVRSILINKMIEDQKFTGTIAVDINFNEGGVSNIDLFIKKRVKGPK